MNNQKKMPQLHFFGAINNEGTKAMKELHIFGMRSC